MQAHERLNAWKLAHRFALEVYGQTDCWPTTERYGLTTQLRRAALSVPTNIAEGAAKLGAREFRRYLDICLGSLAEASYLLLFARDRGILSAPDWLALEETRNRVGQTVWRLYRAMQQRVRATQPR